MPESLRTDRLTREELAVLQSHALRAWKESDWLATHDPRAWQAIADARQGPVAIDLGAHPGAANQRPGMIALGGYGQGPFEIGDKPLDLHWDLSHALPFESATVDAYNFSSTPKLSRDAQARLAREIARTLRVAGTVTLPDRAWTSLFDPDTFFHDDDSLTLTKTVGVTHDDAPLMVKEVVLGTPTPERPRLPSPY